MKVWNRLTFQKAHVFGRAQNKHAWTDASVFLPTASMPLSRSPDISLLMLFSTSLPHICWYSWNTTHRHTRDNTANIYIQTDLSPDAEQMTLPLFKVPALRWGLLLAHKMALNLDSSVPSLFSPAAYRACKEPENISVAKSGPHKHTHTAVGSKLHLSVLLRQRNVNIFSFITITLKAPRRNTSVTVETRTQRIQVTVDLRPDLSERDEKPSEVAWGVSFDGVLQRLLIFWKVTEIFSSGLHWVTIIIHFFIF